MTESSPGAPGASGGSFPRGPDPDDATALESDTLLFRRYRVRRELGRGGMGVVLLAHDTALDIDVAVKLIPDLMVKDTEAVADLRKEVLRGMALAHPGIVRTHNFEKDESGAGIVMEFIDGESLTDLKLKQAGKCFEPEEILPWLEQLCAVLDYAHLEAHIVHRDLKPRNIMLTKAGRVKVADFGIAAVVSDSMSRHSMEGVVSGTLSYMSPQQAEGKRPSHLDDIYALGATIYELLTGKPPFFRGNPASIQAQVFGVTPPRVAERREDLEVLGRNVIPPAWEETIAVCLAKDPAQRPQSAGEMLMRLKLPKRTVSETPQGAAIFLSPSMPRVPEAPTSSGAAAAAQGDRNVAPPWPAAHPPPRSRARLGWTALAIFGLGAAGTGIWFGTNHSGEKSQDPTPRLAVVPTPVPQPPKATLATATKDAPFINSLGMEFVPVPGTDVFFGRWETRVKDYRAFADATKHEVIKPSFAQMDEHPAVKVSWNDAKAFCAWLSKKEGLEYRLPADEEWSVAVGLPHESGVTPAEKDEKIADVFPWGSVWPPPKGAGNYDSSLQVDSFENTAPVGSFPANRFGIHDLGGNAWEWCEDLYKPGSTSRVLRGGSFGHSIRVGLLSSFRSYNGPTSRGDINGFRVVVVGASSGR